MNVKLAEELKAIAIEERAKSQNEKIKKDRIDTEIPLGILPIKDQYARLLIFSLRDKSPEEKIKGIKEIRSYSISSPGVNNDEINAVLRLFGSDFRAGFAHGYHGGSGWSRSSWGYYRESEGIHASFISAEKPANSISAIVFLLSLTYAQA